MTHMLISLIIIALAISIAANWNAETASALRSEIAEILSADVSRLPPAQQPAYTPTPTQTATATPASEQTSGRVYLDKVIPPCTLVTVLDRDPCGYRSEMTPFTLVQGWSAPYDYRDFLDEATTRIATTHIVLRGTAMPDTARCKQERSFFHRYQELLEGTPRNLDEHGASMVCFIDVSVQEYITGKGAPKITVVVYDELPQWVPAKDVFLALEIISDKVDGVDTLEGAVEMIENGWGDDRTLADSLAKHVENIFAGYEWVLYLKPSPLVGIESWSMTTGWAVVKRSSLPSYAIDSMENGSCERNLCAIHRSEPTLRNLQEFSSLTQKYHKLLVNEYKGRIDAAPNAALLVQDTYELPSMFNAVGAYDHPFVTPAPPPPIPGENDPYTPGTNVDDPPPGGATVTVPGGPDDTATDTPTPTSTPTSTPALNTP